MPYLITTYRDHAATPIRHGGRTYGTPTRRAVGTLDEAREKAAYTIAQGWATDAVGQWWLEAQRLPDSGGTIGPLPDGTVIEVEPTEWGDLVRAGRLDRDADDEQLIIDAYNAAQED